MTSELVSCNDIVEQVIHFKYFGSDISRDKGWNYSLWFIIPSLYMAVCGRD